MAEFSDVSKNYSDGEKQVTAKVFFQEIQNSLRGRDKVQVKVLNRFFDNLINEDLNYGNIMWKMFKEECLLTWRWHSNHNTLHG